MVKKLIALQVIRVAFEELVKVLNDQANLAELLDFTIGRKSTKVITDLKQKT